METRYIIVQAGGKGSRMEELTKNKPKALVPVENLPMIFHLFRKFPNKKYLIIGDYKEDVLRRYLEVFAEVDWRMISTDGKKGTIAGIKNAMEFIPQGESFLLIWCDLILGKDDDIPTTNCDAIGIAENFPCRWSYMPEGEEKYLQEEIAGHGIAGFFVFKDKSSLADIPESGEFVRYLKSVNHDFSEVYLKSSREYGLYSEWAKLPQMRCRPFNRLNVVGNKVIKEGIDDQGRALAEKEIAWYDKIKDANFKNIPYIYKTRPLTMEFINGKNIYEYGLLPISAKRQILTELISCLKETHSLGSIPADKKSFFDAYIGKTYKRLEKVQKLVPFADRETIVVNGKTCRNIFFCKEKTEEMVWRYFPKKFEFIHGDPTFSNILLRDDAKPVLIDPRGYFGNIQFYGDPSYDWVKLYYSLLSNYDQFNLKRFRLVIEEDSVTLDIASNGWEALEDDFFRLLSGEVTRLQMKLFLGLTWLSLTTYAWEDYDSICGAFYQGLWYLEEAFEEESAYGYFEKNLDYIKDALQSIAAKDMYALIKDCELTLNNHHRIIASGLGKNVPICEKFVGTMLSMGLDAGFLHTNSAVHGDMGMIKKGDTVILLSKSGETAESIYLAELLKEREGVNLWLLTFTKESSLTEIISNRLTVTLENEGDLWNIMPNNSTTVTLMILQTLAVELSKKLCLKLKKDFQPNHPGGAIGAKLRRAMPAEEKAND